MISIRRQDLEFDANESENLFVEIKLTSKKVVVIGVLYRHPASNFSKFQEQLLQTLDKLGQNKQDFVLCGDFNIDLLKQEFKLCINDHQNAIYSKGCCNIINKPTRITESSATLIDHIYTNATNNITSRGILIFEISHHMPTFCTLSLSPINNPKKVLIREIKNFDKESFLNNVNDLAIKTNNSITSCNENLDLDETMDMFLNSLVQILNQHAPIRAQTRKEFHLSKKPWISKGFLKSIQTKNVMFKKCY